MSGIFRAGFAIVSLTLAMTLALPGCATTKSVEPLNMNAGGCAELARGSDAQCFGQPEDPPDGKARLYVFRPDLSDRGTKDVPTLTIDDSIEVTISRLSYASFDLEPGEHSFILKSAPGDTENWNLSGVLDVAAAGRYYLAIWNIDTAYDSGMNWGTARSVLISTTVGVATMIASGGLAIIPIPDLSAKSTASKSQVKFEVVKEEDALESIRECVLSKPRPVQNRQAP